MWGLPALLIPADPGCQAGRSTDSAPPPLLNPVPDVPDLENAGLECRKSIEMSNVKADKRKQREKH